MKRFITVGLLAFGLTKLALAKPLPADQKGDPKKDNQAPAFSLSSGYFSLFNFFQEVTIAPMVPDTAKTTLPKPKEENKKVTK